MGYCKQNESFSIEGFINYVSAAKWQWIALAFLCMVGFIVFEGLAVLQLCKAFGYKEKVKRGICLFQLLIFIFQPLLRQLQAVSRHRQCV